jgi:hypothetical protein
MKAQKKPVIIDYIEVTFPLNLSEIRDWVSSFGDDFRDKFQVPNNPLLTQLFVNTLEGTSYSVSSDDVIIRGIKGEYYPCKKDIF